MMKIRAQFSSRQYMLNEDYEIYYYSDLHFSPVAMHNHNYYEFYLFCQGKVTLYVGKQKISLQAGDLIIVPPGVPHHLDVEDPSVPYRRFIFWISKRFVADLTEKSTDYIWLLQEAGVQGRHVFHMNQESFQRVQAEMINLLEELNVERYGSEEAASLRVHSLLLTMNRTIYEQENPSVRAEGDDLFANVVTYVEAHLNENLSLEKLADVFYLSRFYIAHAFKETLGISLHQFILKKRLRAAADALLDGEGAASIYPQLGFSDYSSFYRAFKKEYGLSPKAYQDVYCRDPGVSSDTQSA